MERFANRCLHSRIKVEWYRVKRIIGFEHIGSHAENAYLDNKSHLPCYFWLYIQRSIAEINILFT